MKTRPGSTAEEEAGEGGHELCTTTHSKSLDSNRHSTTDSTKTNTTSEAGVQYRSAFPPFLAQASRFIYLLSFATAAGCRGFAKQDAPRAAEETDTRENARKDVSRPEPLSRWGASAYKFRSSSFLFAVFPTVSVLYPKLT